jgi:hypothetical protein
MTASIDRMHWLKSGEHAALLTRVVCGDWLSPSGDKPIWFALSRVTHAERGLLVRYQADDAAMRLCAVLPERIDAEWVTMMREQVSPQGAEIKWAHFVAQLGRYDSIADANAPAWTESTFTHEGETWRARRERHPSAVIDRLLARDRAEMGDQLQAALRETSGRGNDNGVGDTPSPPQRAKVGDTRSE